MKTYRCYRYRCDYCRKSGCNKSALVAHEARCFKNPNRVCPLCSEGPGQTPLPELIALLDGICEGNKDEKIKAVQAAAEGCPACTLAALNQIPPMEIDYENPEGTQGFTRKVSWAFSFDYKKARDAWFADNYDRPGFVHCP